MKPENPKTPTIGVWRPTTIRHREDEIALARLAAPADFSPAGVVLLSWIRLPSSNQQEVNDRKSPMINQTWKRTMLEDFRATLALQEHPGLIDPLRLFVRCTADKASDLVNLHRKFKYAYDLLQIPKTFTAHDECGRRREWTTGALSLIENDRDLYVDPRSGIEELRPVVDRDGLKRHRLTLYAWGD